MLHIQLIFYIKKFIFCGNKFKVNMLYYSKATLFQKIFDILLFLVIIVLYFTKNIECK